MNRSNCLIGLFVLVSLGFVIGGVLEYIWGYGKPEYCQANMFYNEGTGDYTPNQIKQIYDECMGDAAIERRNGIIFICIGCFGMVSYCIVSLYFKFRKYPSEQSPLNNVVISS